ncbi:MAG TPA: hypothetical protein VNG33_23565 [Polyangiaceae bacterium]|nr:hypothetical protein [Polyangiaceae bacterium]
MNPLSLLVALVTLCVLAFTYRREIFQEYVFTLGTLQYNPGGLVVPNGYWVPGMPSNSGAVYPPPAGRVSSAAWIIADPTIGDYNTKTFTLRRQNADGGFTAIEFEFYRAPTAAPSLPIIGIDLTGFTTVNQIAAEIMLVLRTQGFVVQSNGANHLTVSQPFAGDAGDLGFFVDFNGLNAINIGPDFGSTGHVFASSGNTAFFGGGELSVPIRIGMIYGVAPVAPPPVV